MNSRRSTPAHSCRRLNNNDNGNNERGRIPSSSFMLALVLACLQSASSSGAVDTAGNGHGHGHGHVELHGLRRRSQTAELQHYEDQSSHYLSSSSNNRQRNTQASSCHPNSQWHASTTRPQTCTNDNATPSSWETNPSMNNKYMFNNWVDCCENMFGSVNECEKLDVCSNAGNDVTVNIGDGGGSTNGGNGGRSEHSCGGRLWHPDITASTT